MRIERGVQRVLWGFFKKMVIADTAAVFVDAIFDQYQAYNGLAIFGVLAYSAQLYGDFSGGMDVVIGIASMFGIEMDENFKRPYFSISITDFWHRWHITLGTWMKDYLFYPLSLYKRNGQIRKICKEDVTGKREWTSITNLCGKYCGIPCSRYLAWCRLEVYRVWSV